MNLEEIERMEAEAEALLAGQAVNAPEGETGEVEAEDKQEKAVEVPEIKAEEPPTEKAEDKVTDTGIEGLTLENAQERLLNAEASRKSMQANMTRATQEAAQLRRENESMRSEIESLKKSVEQLQVAEKPVEKPADPEPDQLSKFREQYGEEFDPVVNGIAAASERASAVDQKVTELDKKLAELQEAKEKAELDAAWERHWGAVKSAHPDADSIVSSEDYRGWLLRQPQYVQDADAQGTTDAVIDVLQRYKDSQKTTQKSSDNLLDKAKEAAEPVVGSVKTPPNGSDDVPYFTQAEIAEMITRRPLEYAEKEHLIDEAARMGRIR